MHCTNGAQTASRVCVVVVVGWSPCGWCLCLDNSIAIRLSFFVYSFNILNVIFVDKLDFLLLKKGAVGSVSFETHTQDGS